MNKISNIIKKVIIDLIIVILAIIAVLAVCIFVQLNIQNKEYIDILGYSMFSTATGSMAPTIGVGDIVFVKIGETTKEKDIITYKKDNEFITHRIVKSDRENIITRGDNNNTDDDAITKDMILGKVVFIVKNVEVWKRVFSDFNVIIPIIITIILIVILVAYKETGEKND